MDINNPAFNEDPYARIPFQDDEPKDDVFKIPEKLGFKRDKTMSQRNLMEENQYQFDGPSSGTTSPEPPYVTSSQIRPNFSKNSLKDPDDTHDDGDGLKKDRVMLPPKGNDRRIRAVPNQYATVQKNIAEEDPIPLTKDELVNLSTEEDENHGKSPTTSNSGNIYDKPPPIPVRRDIETRENHDDPFDGQDPFNGQDPFQNDPPNEPEIPQRTDITKVPPIPRRRMQSRSSVAKERANQYETLGSHTFQKKTNELKDADEESTTGSPYDHLNHEFNC